MLKEDFGVSDLGSRTIPSKNLRSEYVREEELGTLQYHTLKRVNQHGC